MTLKNPYWTAGTLEGKAYIERDADLRLRKELLENQRYIFLFGPRHGGTSSLVTHCMDSLSPGQYCCTRIDLSKLPHTDYQTLIGALLDTIANDTALDKQEILTDFPEDTILAWLSTFPQRLILFLDEVQAIGELPFRDQVFGKLRFLYNVRVENEQYTRLQVVLSGSVHPERLIPANLATPFVGGSIAVLPLTQKQVEKLTWDLETAQVQIDPQVSTLLYQQTGGVVHLCQRILHEVWEHAEKTHANVAIADVECVIDRMVAAANKEPHFQAIYQAMIEDPARLAVFLRFVKGDPIDAGVLQDLTLTGLCDPERPYLCTIYERVFGPGGSLDLGMALRHSQVTGQMEVPPSQNTPEVNIAPPPESRREYSLLTKLPTAPYSIIETQMLLPEPPQPQPLPLPGVVIMEASSEESAPYLPPMPMGPSMGTPSVNTPTANRPIEQAAAARASVEATATGLDSTELPAPEFSSPELSALSEPPPPPSGASGSGEVVEIDAPEIEEPTWVDKNPVKKMSDQVAAAKAAADRPQPSMTSGSIDPKVEQTRLKLADKLMLSAELDSFCASFFPHVAQKFAPGMSRAEKTDLLLGLVAASEINKRLREWSSRIELNQEVISSVTSRGSAASAGAASAGSEAVQSSRSTRSGPAQLPTPPPPSAPPVIEDSASFKAPGPMQVGVGLVLANRYFLTTEVGRGSVAVVWSAYDRIKDEQVALKLIFGPAADKPTVLEVFWRSAQQMAALSHPAIVGVLNKPREENEVHYVVMEFLPGGNLRQWVQGGKLNRGQILRVLQRLGAGLQYAHERRVMHRNIKPANILFDGTGHARLTDFNIVWPAEVAGSTETRSDRLIFMAPEEQIGGGGDPRSDVYSLGMCALYAFYGQELPSRVVQDRSSFIDALDATPAIKAVLRRATAASPAERFASAAEFCRALEFDSPALPGISVRNSLSSIPAIKAERSGPESPAPLSSNSMRQAPQLSNNPAMYAPGVPNAPSGASAPSLPESQLVSPPMPIVIPGLHAPDLLIPQSDPRASKRDPDSGEIPPMPGRNPQNVAQYAIDTDRTRAVGTPLPLGGPPQVMVPMPSNRQRRWQPLAYAGIALLALGGGGLGYWWGTQKANTVVVDTSGPVVVADNRPTQQPAEFNRPLRMEPLVQPQPQPEPPPAAPVPTPPTGEKMLAAGNPAGKKPGTPMVVAMNPPTAAKPGQKPVAPVVVGSNTTQAKGTVVAMNSAAKPGQKPVAPPVAAPPTAAKPTVVAMNPSTAAKPGQKPGPAPGVGPNTTQAKLPVVAKAQQPAAKPVAAPAKPVTPPTKLAMVQPTKGTVDTMAKAPPVAPKAAETPVQRPKVAAAPPPKAKAPPPRPVVAPTPPPRPVTPATQPSSAEAEATLQAAQGAFVRGQHQQAIAMAMQVTTRGGPDAIKAWRFVGGAACSVRSAQLATNAYNHLRDPGHRQLLVDLCRRNGLQFNGSSFMSEE